MPCLKPYIFAALLIPYSLGYCATNETINLTKEQALAIGQKIWLNEGLAKVENLTVWNKGEDFPSLGIGHFIWYPPGVEKKFTEQFPQFVEFVSRLSVNIPAWLAAETASPWLSRDAFYADFESERMRSLRQFLVETNSLQVAFIVQRMEVAVAKMLTNLPATQQKNISELFYRVAAQPTGTYALIDYINFKGEGISIHERYNGEGWGLLQVLENMDSKNPHIMKEFINAADYVLTRRVKNASRDESMWLPGWRKRLNTYLDMDN